MSGISPRTAEVALVALGIALDRAAPRRNGLPEPDFIQTARRELTAASTASGTDVGPATVAVQRFRQLDVAEAAQRLGLTPRGVRKRIERGHLAAHKVGASWAVDWEEDING